MALVTSVWEAKVREPHLFDAETSMALEGALGACSRVFPTFDRKANTHWLLFSQQWFKIKL